MVPRSIGGIEVVGIIGTDGDVVTYAGDHPEHGTVALTILSNAAARTPGAVEEYVAECERRAADPTEAEHLLGHGVDDGIAWQMTRLRGPAPTIHPLPPPINRTRRWLALAMVVIVLFAIGASVLRSSDIATLSPDERSWAIDLEGEWERSDGDEPLSITANQSDGPLVVRGLVVAGAPNAAAALDVVQATEAAAQSVDLVSPVDGTWELGADIVTGDGHDRLVRIVSRPCAAFSLTVDSVDGAFDEVTERQARDLSRTFRRIGVPPTFEKGAEAPDGFTVIDQNGIRLALPGDASLDGDGELCLRATLAGGAQVVSLEWTAGEDEASMLASWEADIDAAGGSVLSEALTNRGKQRRVAATGRGSFVLYVVEDDSGAYSLAFDVPGVVELGASDLVVFDLIASTFEVTGAPADPS